MVVIVDAMATHSANVLQVSPNISKISLSESNKAGLRWHLESNVIRFVLDLRSQDTTDHRCRLVALNVFHQIVHSCLTEIKHNNVFSGDLQVQRRRWLAPFSINFLFDFREERARNVDVFIVVSWFILHSYILDPLDELIIERKCCLANDKDVNSQASVVIKNLLC